MYKSYFKKAVDGEFGEAIKIRTENEVMDLVMEAKREAIVEPDGAIRWIKSGNYVPDDCCEMLEWANYPFDREATAIKRDKQIDEFIKEYRSQPHQYTEEELYEMRSAFGEEETIVNVITGERITL